MANIPIGGQLDFPYQIASVDKRFGPYASVAAAYEALGPDGDDVITAGLPFGITEADGSTTWCIWTKTGGEVTDYKRISHMQVVPFAGVVTTSVTIAQVGGLSQDGSTIKYLAAHNTFGYQSGTSYVTTWQNDYIWIDGDTRAPYKDILYVDKVNGSAYFYNGTTFTELTPRITIPVTSVNGKTGAVVLTKSDIGLGNVDNTSDVNKPISTATQTALDAKANASDLTSHTGNTNNPHQVTKAQVGLGNVDNTADADKNVNSAVKDGSGNTITDTYETKTHATSNYSSLQGDIDSLAAIAANLTGLEGTNFGGFSLAVDAATAVSNIPTVFTQNGCTVGQLYWFLAGADMSALVAYKYNGTGSATAISATEYDFTDFSGLSEQVKDFKGTITSLSALDALYNTSDVGVYHLKVSQMSGLLIVEKHNDGLTTTISQQLIGSGTPTNQGGSYVIEAGQTLARRTYSSGAWTAWNDPIATLKSQVAALGPKCDEAYNKTRDTIEHTRNLFDAASVMDGYYIASSNGINLESGYKLVAFPCEPSTTYTISKIVTARFRVGYTKVTPAFAVGTFGVITNHTAASITITTGEDAQYIAAWVYGANESVTWESVLASLQIEEGSEATEYVAPGHNAKDTTARANILIIQTQIGNMSQTLATNTNSIAQVERGLNSSTLSIGASDVIENYWRGYAGGINSSNSYFYTNPILLRRGDKVVITGANITDVVGAIVEVDSQNNFVSLIYRGAGTTADYTYTLNRDMYVGLSALKSQMSCFAIQTKGVFVRLGNNETKIDELSKAIASTEFGLSLDDVTLGYYRVANGSIAEQSSYFYSKAIKVHKGDRITTSENINLVTNVSIISKVSADNTYISTLKAGTGENGQIDYTMKEDCYISISALKSKRELFVITTASIDDRLEDMSSIAPGTDGLPQVGNNPLTEIRRDQGYGAIIRKWGIIGDSLSSGEMQCYDSESASSTDYKFIDMYRYSYGQVFARLNGVECYNYSNGGQTAWNWIKGNTTAHDETYIGGVGGGGWWLAQQEGQEKDAYIIAMGVNDRTKINNGDYALGSASHITTYDGTNSDIDDTTTYPKSYARYYAGIIQRILSIQPKAKIFCMTPLGDDFAEIAQVIRDVVAYFGGNVYLIDMATYIPEDYKVTGFMLNGHLSPMGYAYIGYLVNTYIDWIIRNNTAAFKDTALIGTDYRPNYS